MKKTQKTRCSSFFTSCLVVLVGPLTLGCDSARPSSHGETADSEVDPGGSECEPAPAPDPDEPESTPTKPVDLPPSHGACLAGTVVTAECFAHDGLARPCDIAFVQACADEGNFVPLDAGSEGLLQFAGCESGSPLQPECNADFVHACRDVGGLLVAHPDGAEGACVPDVKSRALQAGFSDEGLAFLATISTIEIAPSDTGGVETRMLAADGTVRGQVRLQYEDAGLRTEAEFDGGLMHTFVPVSESDTCIDAGADVTGTLTLAQMTERTAILGLAAPGEVQRGLLGCLGRLAVGVGVCSPPSVATGFGTVACGGAALAAACKCFEKEIEKRFGDVC